MGHVLRHGEELHYTKVESAVKGRIPLGRPRNSNISQLKKDAGISTYAGLKRLAKDREKRRTKLNAVNQPITGRKKTKGYGLINFCPFSVYIARTIIF